MRAIKRFEEKVAQSKLTKIQHGQRVRDIRINYVPKVGEIINTRICRGCGFRIRGAGHLEGAHHNGVVPACHRGR
jgi:hypothetical protein